MAWGAIIGSIVSGYMASRASSRAAGRQERMQRQGLNQYQQMFGQAREQLAPYQQAGQRALTALEQMAGLRDGDFDFQNDPGYRFRMEEGQQAVERGAAARGGLLSGGHTRELTRFAQGQASQEFSNAFRRLAGIANMGQQASGVQAQSMMQQGAGTAQQMSGIGQTQAAGLLGQGQAWQQGLNQASLLWGYHQANQGQDQTPATQQNEALQAALRNPSIFQSITRR